MATISKTDKGFDISGVAFGAAFLYLFYLILIGLVAWSTQLTILMMILGAIYLVTRR